MRPTLGEQEEEHDLRSTLGEQGGQPWVCLLPLKQETKKIRIICVKNTGVYVFGNMSPPPKYFTLPTIIKLK